MSIKEIIERIKKRIISDLKCQDRHAYRSIYDNIQNSASYDIACLMARTLKDLKKAQVEEEKLIKEFKQLEQDNEDMRNSHQTSFRRCNKCGRISDSNYCCFYCGHDNSDTVEG